MKYCNVSIFLMLVLIKASIANATLEWESLTYETVADIGVSEVKASFNFVNNGDYVVNIKGIVPGCGCTAVELKDKSISPGEAGQITAILHVGSRQGLQHKSIRVHTDDEQEPVVELTLKCYIPKLAEILPKVLFWKLGETPNGKHIEIINKQDEALHIKSISISSHAFSYNLQTIKDGREYKLAIVPNSTELPIRAANVFIEMQSEKAAKRYIAYVGVK